MPLAIFDLDHTLLAGDSDYAWGQFLAERNIVDAVSYEQQNRRYYEQYCAGTLDIHEFLAFSLAPLRRYDRAVLDTWHREYYQEKIVPMIRPAARALVERHRRQGHTLVVITATNSFIVKPIVAAFGISHLLATEPEFHEGRFTGRVVGTPCFREGKVARLHAWLAEQGLDLKDSWFYSDSHNDLPLLREVTHPVAVNPDELLRGHAERHGWPILDLNQDLPESNPR